MKTVPTMWCLCVLFGCFILLAPVAHAGDNHESKPTKRFGLSSVSKPIPERPQSDYEDGRYLEEKEARCRRGDHPLHESKEACLDWVKFLMQEDKYTKKAKTASRIRRAMNYPVHNARPIQLVDEKGTPIERPKKPPRRSR